MLDKRIIPGLVLRHRDQGGDPGNGSGDYDPDKDPPVQPDGEDSPKGHEDRSVFQKAFAEQISKLKPIDAAICILTAWNVLDDEQKKLYRPIVIFAGVERRMKKVNPKKPESSEKSQIEQYAQETEKSLQDAEQRSEVSASENRQRAGELQSRIAKHHCVINIISKLKQKCASRFLAQGGIRDVATNPGNLDASNAGDPIKTESAIRSELLEICKLAVSIQSDEVVKRPSKKQYQKAFRSIYPLDSIYKDFQTKHGAPKIINTPLWLLRRFGEYCQEECFHWNALLAYRKAYASMKSSLGLQDQDIATVLAMTPSNVAKRRCEYRKKVFNDFFEEMPGLREMDISEEARTSVCFDYQH